MHRLINVWDVFGWCDGEPLDVGCCVRDIFDCTPVRDDVGAVVTILLKLNNGSFVSMGAMEDFHPPNG